MLRPTLVYLFESPLDSPFIFNKTAGISILMRDVETIETMTIDTVAYSFDLSTNPRMEVSLGGIGDAFLPSTSLPGRLAGSTVSVVFPRANAIASRATVDFPAVDAVASRRYGIAVKIQAVWYVLFGDYHAEGVVVDNDNDTPLTFVTRAVNTVPYKTETLNALLIQNQITSC